MLQSSCSESKNVSSVSSERSLEGKASGKCAVLVSVMSAIGIICATVYQAGVADLKVYGPKTVVGECDPSHTYF